MWGTEEADDTDKNADGGEYQQAYIDSSLRYYHDVIQQGVALENIAIRIQSGLSTMKKPGRAFTGMSSFLSRKVGLEAFKFLS